MSAPTCQRCGHDYALRDGCEATPECDSCAHLVLVDLRNAVTHPAETKADFINRINAILNPE